MKKLFFLATMLLAGLSAQAQNVQLHYDFGRSIYSDEEAGRQKVTVTFEQFKADNIGSWFWFIDLDMYHDGMKGAYTEISREFNVGKSGFAAHIEYDGGMTTFHGTDAYNLSGGLRYQSAALIGPAWNGHNSDFSKTWSIQLLYKQFIKYGSKPAFSSVQLTGVWGIGFAGGKGTFSGFIDFWRDKNSSNGHGRLTILTEPQLWYNANSHFSIGSEIEISNNFIVPDCDTDKTFYINPTLAVKYVF